MTKDKTNNLAWRVAQLEKCSEIYDVKLDQIMTNHLPHINESIIALKTRMNVMTAINVGAIIAGIIIVKLLG